MMKRETSIKKNFIMNAILTMSSFIFPLITYPYVARILTPVGTGRVAFATSLISYFNMFAQLGIPTYGIRECAKVRDNKTELTRTVHELLFINLMMSVVSYVLLALALIFVPRLHEDRTLYIIVSLTIVLQAIGLEWLYKALEQYTYITVRSIIFKFVALVCMFGLIHEQKDYVIYGAITILAASASNILNLMNAHKYIGFKSVGGYQPFRHMKAIMVFFAMACATTIYTNLDTIMLGFMTSDVDTGYYDAAVKIKRILVSVVTSLGTVLLPRVSYYIQNNRMDEFKRISAKALNFVFLVASPLTLYFILFARQGILFLSGPMYEGAILPMQIIMPTLILIGLTNIMGIQILIPLGKENIVLYSEIAGAITDLILNAIFIPKIGASGASLGTLVAEFVVLLVQYHFLKDELKNTFKEIHYIQIGIAMLIGTAASLWVLRLHMGNFVTMVISAILFFGTYGMFLLFRKEPLITQLFNDILRKMYNSR